MMNAGRKTMDWPHVVIPKHGLPFKEKKKRRLNDEA